MSCRSAHVRGNNNARTLASLVIYDPRAFTAFGKQRLRERMGLTYDTLRIALARPGLLMPHAKRRLDELLELGPGGEINWHYFAELVNRQTRLFVEDHLNTRRALQVIRER